MSTNKVVSAVLIVFFLVVGMYLSLKNQEKLPDLSLSTSNEGGVATPSGNKVGEHKSPVTSGSKSSIWNPMGGAISSEEIKKWFAERGNYKFYGPDILSDYQGYDMETLSRLSDSGDIKAMHVMADRATNFDDMKKHLWRAAVYGSTEALIQLGASNENSEGSIKELPGERQREKILEILSYYEVAQMRGDWWGNITGAPSLIDRFQVELSENDKLLIKQGAEQIYNNLQAQRAVLGLGEFDNSVPDEVIKFYEEMLRPL